MENFEWTDELVQEFLYFKQISWPVMSTQQRIDEFKARKKLKPLFTTEDGVDVFKGTKVWFVNKKYDLDFHDFDEWSDLHYPDLYKYFSNEDAAKSYILHNKPIEVSYKELSEIIYKNWEPLENAKDTALRIRNAIKDHLQSKTTK
jgi:hypothetical protein